MNTRERFRPGQESGENVHLAERRPVCGEKRSTGFPARLERAAVQWEILISYNTALFPKKVQSAKDCLFLYWLREPNTTGPQLARSNRHHLLLTIRKPSHHHGPSPLSCTCKKTRGGLQGMAPFPCLSAKLWFQSRPQ